MWEVFMKSKVWYKVLGLLCVLSLLIGTLSACGTGNGDSEQSNNNSEQETSSNGSSTDTNEVTSNVDENGKYVDGIEISFVRGIDDDLASNILPKTPGETVEDNRWLDAYRDTLGIDVSYDWIVKGNETSDAFVQKLNVTLASGELPDVILVNPSQLKQLAESDMIMDMTPYYEEYGSDLLKDVYTQEGDGLLNSVTFDGKLMAIPDMVSMVETTQYLWIRKDWLDNLGLDVPKTMEDLLVVIEAFATQDPDGNGVDDTLGLAITKELYGGAMGLEGFFSGYGAYPNIWVEDDQGDLVYGSVLPEVKDALEVLADMYKKGYLDREFGIKDGGKVSENIVAGMYGVEYGAQWNPMWPLINNYNNDPEADWTAYPIVALEGETAKVPLAFTSSRYFAVSKDFEYPEALVKMCNLHMELNWGKTNDFNKYYMPVENGGVGVWKFSPVTPFPPFKNHDAFIEIENARKSGDFSQLTGEPKVIQENIEAFESGDTSQWGWERIYGEDGAFGVLSEYLENDQLIREKFVGAPTDTMTEKLSTLQKMEVEEFVKIIMGESPIEAYDEFVENWYNLGGQAITDEVNAWYDSLD
jgi:putative aldouronate transport system substrate-binding protein